ncbi:replication protein [Ornithinibacillus sp. JPR2-1]|uniref:replication protein n=1 Tax=Ornithinibacillus sp. JPR2-1 TaxID=2094019 RepID=UPI0031D83E8C
MASPQTEKGYIRIANELWNEILRRNFSKRQLNLILFIWRLSYGTGQKDCKIDKFNLLELAGMYKQDVKKELKFLRDCAVLNWDETTMIFSINKDYHLWQITPNKNWDDDKFSELIHQNLARKKVSKTLTVEDTPKPEKVSKTLTYKSKLVSKILTTKLVKYLPTHAGNAVRTINRASLKTLLKTLIIKDIKRKEEEEKKDAVIFYDQYIGRINPLIIEKIQDWEKDLSTEIVIRAMEEAMLNNVLNWKYINNTLRDWYQKGARTLNDVDRLTKEFQERKKNNNKFRPYQQKPSEIVPDWFKDRKKQSNNLPNPEPEASREDVAAMLEQYKRSAGGS